MSLLGRRDRGGVLTSHPLARVDWPGRSALSLYLAHATGFCKEVWEPFVDELRATGHELPVVAWDSAGHGDSYLPDPPFDWWEFGRDVLRVVDRRPAVGVGHSSGATVMAMAEMLEPGTFSGLVLVEPIVLPPPFERHEHLRLATGAERRRECFDTAEEAEENFAGKEAFAGWDERALRAYVRGGLRARDGGLCLKCPPWAEAEVYRTAAAHGAWQRLGEVEIPVLLLAGARSESHPEAFVRRLTDRFHDGALVLVEGVGHFLPMERPDLLARLVGDFVRERLGERIS